MSTPSKAAMEAAKAIARAKEWDVDDIAECIDHHFKGLVEAGERLCDSVEDGHNELGKAMDLRAALRECKGGA